MGRPRSPLESRGSPGHDPGTPGDVLGTPGTPLGPQGTLLGAPGTPLGPPGDVPETPQGRPWDPRAPPGTPYGPLMDHKNGHISTNRQRQKLLIAVFDAAHQGPSHERLDRTVPSIRSPPKSKKNCHGISTVGTRSTWPPMFTDIYILARTCQ